MSEPARPVAASRARRPLVRAAHGLVEVMFIGCGKSGGYEGPRYEDTDGGLQADTDAAPAADDASPTTGGEG